MHRDLVVVMGRDIVSIQDVNRRDDGLHEVTFLDGSEPFVGGLCTVAIIHPVEQADIIEICLERTSPSETWKREFDPDRKLDMAGNYLRIVKEAYDDVMGIIKDRLRRGDVLEDIARRAQMSDRELAHFLAASSQPSIRTISRIADACGSGLEISFNPIDIK